MKILLLASLVLLFGCTHSKKEKKQTLKFEANPMLAFTLTEGLSHPESALYSAKHKAIFVSNVASGNPMETKRVGYISKVAADGSMIKAKWVTKLKAPKGIAIVGDEMFVSDVNEIVKINIPKGKIVKTWKVKDAIFLNDVVADKKGNVYISDMNANVIHVIIKNILQDWIRTPALRGPNGLFTDGSAHILVTQWGSDVDSKTWMAKNAGHLAAISLKEFETDIIEDQNLSGHLDGIDSDLDGNLFVSDWISGDIWSVMKNGKAIKCFNFGQGTADISVAKELKLLLVPQMNQSKLMAIKLR